MNYDNIRNRPSQFIALTGLTVAEFDQLLDHFEQHWNKYNKRYTYGGKLRKNKPPKRTKGKLPTISHKLFFILYYYKTNPLQEVLAASFDMDQARANKWISKIEKVLKNCLKALNCLPTRSPEQLYKYLVDEQPEHILLDATERTINRSVDQQIQEEDFSGKKKLHTVKNNIISDFTNRILYLSQTYQGSVHDKAICNQEPLLLPENGTINVWQDTGYQGHSPENAIIMQPIKKQKNKPLEAWQKRFNRTISKIRVRVEHAIGGIKRLRIVKERLRNFKTDCRDFVMLIACGLHNFRISMRPTVKPPQFSCELGQNSQST